MSRIAHELETQPDCWRRAERLAGLMIEALPRRGERALAAGCGTSLHVARAFSVLRETAGAGETDAYPASEVPAGRTYDRVVVISRSGTTTEVVRLLERRAEPSVALVGVGDSPVAELATEVVHLAFADEESVVQTRFATSALALLRAHLGEDLAPAIADAERALAEAPAVDLSPYEHFVFLGQGWSIGMADEAALKVREAASAYSESYPAMEYRHGPISVAGPRSLVWTLGVIDVGLVEDVRATGATVIEGSLDPMAELVRIQRAAVSLAEAKSLDPDHPRHLTRSVVLS